MTHSPYSRPHPLLRALEDARWTVIAAAARIGCTRQTIYARLHGAPGHRAWSEEDVGVLAELTGRDRAEIRAMLSAPAPSIAERYIAGESVEDLVASGLARPTVDAAIRAALRRDSTEA